MPHSACPDLDSLSVSQVETVHQICERFEVDWQRGSRPAVSDYLARVDASSNSNLRLVLLRELLVLEAELRRDDVREHDLDAYLTLFAEPEETEVVKNVLREAARAGGWSRFRVIAEHAAGGLGKVSIAEDQQIQRKIAFKTMQPKVVDDEACRARFIDEARVTGELEHPNIAPVYALGTDRDGNPFYAMRFIEGTSLEAAIGALPQAGSAARKPGERLSALRKLLNPFVLVCNAVAFAHSRGYLHRDIKPHNIMLREFGEVFLVDWGLAKPLDIPRTSAALLGTGVAQGNGRLSTGAGAIVGTLRYMSPEQAKPKPELVGPASDVYSLGATLYHLLTGRPPFDDPDPAVVQAQVIEGTFPAPREIARWIPRQLDAIVRKAMEKVPADRYGSANALAEDIQHWLADEPVSACKDPALERAARWVRRHRTVAAAVTTLLASSVFASMLGVILMSKKNQEVVLALHQRDIEAERFKEGRHILLEYAFQWRLDLRWMLRKGEEKDAIRRFEDLLVYLLELRKLDPSDKEVAERLAEVTGSLAWAELLTGRLKNAVRHASDSTGYAPERVELWVNLAHAYLLTDQDSEARRLYAKYKGTKLKLKLNERKTFDDQVVEDFTELRKRGIASEAKLHVIQSIFGGPLE